MVSVFKPDGTHHGYFNTSDAECWGFVPAAGRELESWKLYRLPATGDLILYHFKDKPRVEEGRLLTLDEAAEWYVEHGPFDKGPLPPLNLSARKKLRSTEHVVILYLGEHCYQVEGHPPRKLTDAEDNVMVGFLEKPVMDQAEMIDKSGQDTAPRILKHIKDKYPEMAPAIHLPRAGRRGGYSVWIRHA
jgi:hypothetical protein